MRLLYLLRGVPGSGKSTWVRENNLEQYTLSADQIRLLYQSPVMNNEGNSVISQRNDNKVWKLLFEVLEDRMSRGEFTIVDATHYKSTLLNRYRELIKKYRYRVSVVDFTDVSLETVIERNNNRDIYKRVPEEVIHRMYAVFKNDTEVSNRFNILSREEAANNLKRSLLYNYDEYNKVVFIGDIHGCYEPLKEYFSEGVKDDTFYIFLGDYTDRGLQNKEVIDFLLTIKDRKNVLLLEGNHCGHLRAYSEWGGTDETYETKATVFKYKTLPQIKDISKKDLRQLCRKLGQFAFFNFGDKVYLATHGGISNVPTLFTQTEDIIKGVGAYGEVQSIDKSFTENTLSNYVTVHGHRNIMMDEIEQFNKRVYNLCDRVEKGGYLRILEVTKTSDGNKHKVIKLKNNIYDESLRVKTERVSVLPKTDNELLSLLNENSMINKKVLDNGIISYNFNRAVFRKGMWNKQTVTARGLFIDSKSENVICRSFNKFFNWSEVDETKSPNLKESLKFPVVAYKKENGFLGMVSYDFTKDNLFVASKSTNEGDFADMLSKQIERLNKEFIKAYTKENNVTLVFEVIDTLNDPHIIRYTKDKLILLAIIKNTLDYQPQPIEEIEKVASILGINAKQEAYTFNDWDSLYSWRQEQKISYDIKYEGWVLEDASGFQWKLKTKYYNFWKSMRKLKEQMAGNKKLSKTFSTLEEVEVYNIMKEMSTENLTSSTILDIQDIYYKTK